MLSRMTVLAISALLTMLAFRADAADLPTGSWLFVGNGFQGTLQINGVDASGNLVSPTVYGEPITGFWNSVTNRITFVRQFGADRNTIQYHVGYYSTVPAAGGLTTHILTGSFGAFGASGASANRPDFGWVAVITK